MKTVRFIFCAAAASLLLSCGSSKKAAEKNVESKPVVTYTQPGAHLLGEKNVLRAWAVGVSDSEMVAKKKAMTEASAQLSSMLRESVKTAVENYCVALTDGDVSRSKQLLDETVAIVSEEVLVGVVPIFDVWEPKNADGMYKNYIVVELSGKDFVKKLMKVVNEENRSKSSGVKIDENLLNDVFLNAINSKLSK